jgi:preprotein translocase subunit SecG
MSGTVLTIIGATTAIIIIYLILVPQGNSGNFATLVGSIGNGYRQIVDTFTGQPYG